MRATKLIALCKATIFILCVTASCQANAGYYIEYMHDPCVDYDACNSPPVHHAYRARSHHYRHHTSHHRRSSASISVYYYWDVYPAYPCETCHVVRHCSSCSEGRSPYTRAPVEYHDNDYRSHYYSAASDVDYDTSTADDMSPYRR